MLPSIEEIFTVPTVKPVSIGQSMVTSFADLQEIRNETSLQLLTNLVPTFRVLVSVMPLLVTKNYSPNTEEVMLSPRLSTTLEDVSEGKLTLGHELWVDLNSSAFGLWGETTSRDSVKQSRELGQGFTDWPGTFAYPFFDDLSYSSYQDVLDEAKLRSAEKGPVASWRISLYERHKLSPLKYDRSPEASAFNEIFWGLAKSWDGSYAELYETSRELTLK